MKTVAILVNRSLKVGGSIASSRLVSLRPLVHPFTQSLHLSPPSPSSPSLSPFLPPPPTRFSSLSSMSADPSNHTRGSSPEPPRGSGSPSSQHSRSSSPSGPDVLTLRALVSTKGANVITGKDGKGVANLHEQTGVKADVSENLPGVHERVISISGSVESVAEACALIAAWLVKALPRPSTPTVSAGAASHTSLRLLVSHKLMGTIIGRSGLKIKAIQDVSGAHMVASKQMLPKSTERHVDIQGSPEAIGRAIEEVGRCLLQDWERGVDTVLYNPAMTDEHPGSRNSPGRGGEGKRYKGKGSNGRRANGESNTRVPASANTSPTADNPANICTRNIAIPSDVVGRIIGRGGSKITEIRRLSGSKISIANAPHDGTDERMFTIVGTPEANEKAISLINEVARGK